MDIAGTPLPQVDDQSSASSIDESPPDRQHSAEPERPFDENPNNNLRYQTGTMEIVERLKIKQLTESILRACLFLNGKPHPKNASFKLLLALVFDLLLANFGDALLIPIICQLCWEDEATFTGCLKHIGLCTACAKRLPKGDKNCAFCLQLEDTTEKKIVEACKKNRPYKKIYSAIAGKKVFVWPKTRLVSEDEEKNDILISGQYNSFNTKYLLKFFALNFLHREIQFHNYHDFALHTLQLDVVIRSPPKCHRCRNTGVVCTATCEHFLHCRHCIENNNWQCLQCGADNVKESGYVRLEHVVLSPEARQTRV